MIEQLKFFISDYRRAAGKNKMRMIFIWMSWGIIGIFLYRLERGLFLLIGSGYKYFRLLFLPLLNIIQSLSRLDISYTTDIGPGMVVLHPVMGITINGSSKIGCNLTLTGGNILGIRHLSSQMHAVIKDGNRKQKSDLQSIDNKPRCLVLGNNVNVGANASIIGPLTIGNNVIIAAMACVVKDAPADCHLMGVPAKIKNYK